MCKLNSNIKLAQSTALEILEEFSNATAISTAGYDACGFILAAVSLAKDGPDVARMNGEIMGSPEV